MLNPKTISQIFGTTFLLVGILGFIPNPIVSANGIFVVNTMHNFVHLLTGAVFFGGVHFGYPRQTTIGIGLYYVCVAVIGFLTKSDMMLGIIHINTADRWLHLGLAAAILAAGSVRFDDEKSAN